MQHIFLPDQRAARPQGGIVPPNPPQLQPRLRFPHAESDAFGPGKARLLQLIAATGSIRTAAAEMKMSYNRAWLLVQAMNRLFRQPLVAVARGGGSGGGAALTATGETVLAHYLQMEGACLKAAQRDWTALQQLLRP